MTQTKREPGWLRVHGPRGPFQEAEEIGKKLPASKASAFIRNDKAYNAVSSAKR
jgi:hypothetical protein